jgi:hypothetical protein
MTFMTRILNLFSFSSMMSSKAIHMYHVPVHFDNTNKRMQRNIEDYDFVVYVEYCMSVYYVSERVTIVLVWFIVRQIVLV